WRSIHRPQSKIGVSGISRYPLQPRTAALCADHLRRYGLRVLRIDRRSYLDNSYFARHFRPDRGLSHRRRIRRRSTRLGKEFLRLLHASSDRWHGVDERRASATHALLPITCDWTHAIVRPASVIPEWLQFLLRAWNRNRAC